jgi:hypothetical protein
MPDIEREIGADKAELRKHMAEDYSARHPFRARILSAFGLI